MINRIFFYSFGVISISSRFPFSICSLSKMSECCISKVPEICTCDKILPKNESACIMLACPEKEKLCTESIKDTICPKPLTVFEHCSQAVAERRYRRSKCPLEKGPLNPLSIPCCLDRIKTTFGNPSVIGESAKELLSPPKSAVQVALETLAGHDLYKFSHQDYFPGEQVTRKYCCPSYDPFMKFGEKTSCDYEGKRTKSLLQPDLNCEPLRLASCRFNNFSERNSFDLGKPRDFLKGSKCLPLDFTHGKPSTHDRYSLGDLLHYRNESQILKGRRNLRSKIARVRTHLKKANATNFDNADQAFRFYDKKKTGCIDACALRDVLQQFNIFLTNKELSELIHDCKETCLNVVDCVIPQCACCCHCMIGLNERKCVEFARPNPKLQICAECSCCCETSACDKVPKKCSNQFCDRYIPECSNKCDKCDCYKKNKILKCDFEECCNPDCDCITCEVINFNEFVNFLTFFPPICLTQDCCIESTRLVKQIDKRGSDFFRTSQEVDSVYGEVDVKNIHTFGKLSDLTKTMIGQIGTSENINLLQSKIDSVKPLLNPSPLLHFGFTDEDLNKPRTKEQIQQIFCRDVAKLTCCQFDEVFDLAITDCDNFTTSVENFRIVLDRWISCGCLSLFK